MEECGICIEPMSTSKFIPPFGLTEDEVDSKDPSCIRLRCGHAYHNTCCIGAFRAGFACPSCREAVPSRVEEYEIYVLEDEESFSVENQQMDSLRARLRTSNKDIRDARRNLKSKTKEYNIMCESLRAERKKYISNALREFRDSKRSEYIKVSRNVKAAISRVEKEETRALIKSFPTESAKEDVRVYIDQVRPYDYDPFEHMRCKDEDAADPLLERFWR